jgi:hypothetical protein
MDVKRVGSLGFLVLVAAGGLSTMIFAAQSRTQTVTGHLVDAVCANNHATEPGYVEQHDRNCNLMPGCIKSGFSLVTSDLKVLKLDPNGAEQALALIKTTDKDKDWKVAVTGVVDGQTIVVSSIKLQ